MSYTVDANIFVAAIRPAEVHNVFSRELLQHLQQQRTFVFCPTLVIPESVAAIARISDDTTLIDRVIAFFEGFFNLELVTLSVLLAHRAAAIARTCRLRGADSVYVAVAEEKNATLITWDVEVLQRGAAIVHTLTPQMWLEQHGA